MWVRSSLLSLLALAGCKAAAKPPAEANPAQVKALAAKMASNMPAPQAVRPCRPEDYKGIPTLTFRSLLGIGGLPIKDDPQHADWINPPELESQAVHDLQSTDTTAQRRA